MKKFEVHVHYDYKEGYKDVSAIFNEDGRIACWSSPQDVDTDVPRDLAERYSQLAACKSRNATALTIRFGAFVGGFFYDKRKKRVFEPNFSEPGRPSQRWQVDLTR